MITAEPLTITEMIDLACAARTFKAPLETFQSQFLVDLWEAVSEKFSTSIKKEKQS